MIYLFSDKACSGVEHLPLIAISFYDKPLCLDDFDAIIFTSKNSVEALDRLHVKWQDKESYAIGEGTATYISSQKGNLVYTAKRAYGEDFAHEISPLLKDKKVFFPRAKEVISPLFEILLSCGIHIHEAIVYETTCKEYDKQHAPSKNAILIFTSPSTVECFLKNFTWDESYTAISIGQKTASSLPLHVKNIISPIQTIEHCIKIAKAN